MSDFVKCMFDINLQGMGSISKLQNMCHLPALTHARVLKQERFSMIHKHNLHIHVFASYFTHTHTHTHTHLNEAKCYLSFFYDILKLKYRPLPTPNIKTGVTNLKKKHSGTIV